MVSKERSLRILRKYSGIYNAVLLLIMLAIMVLGFRGLEFFGYTEEKLGLTLCGIISLSILVTCVVLVRFFENRFLYPKL